MPTRKTCARKSSRPLRGDAKDRGRSHLRCGHLSSVKRYVTTYREGRSLTPKKRPGSKPKLDEGARKLLEANLEDHPEATLPQRREFLRRVVCGVSVSDSTVSRMLRGMGVGPEKKIGGCERERRVAEGSLACSLVAGGLEAERLVVRGRDGYEHLAGTPVCLWSRRGERALASVPRNWGARTSPCWRA
jgi:hypothetical protein